jgi:hypothetical protein
VGLFLNEMILTKNNHAQEKVFKGLGVEKIVEKMMFEMLSPMLLILIDLIALVD